VKTHFLWRPQLRDPADEFVREKPKHLSAPSAALGQGGLERRAKQDGTSVSQFVATAVAENLAAIEYGRSFR